MRKLTPEQLIADRRYIESARVTLERGHLGEDRAETVVEIAEALLSHIDAIAPKDLTSVGELNRLPVRSVVLTPQGYVLDKLSDGWFQGAIEDAYHPNEKWLPARVLHVGEKN